MEVDGRLRYSVLNFGPRGLLYTALAVTFLTAGSVSAEEAYHCYFGNTHSHTTYSDGKETPSDHCSKAKAAGYDFYAVTNHALAKYKSFTPETYESTRADADKLTDSTFVAIAGFEFSENDGPGGKGHLTALNTKSYLDATGSKVNFPVFYDWLVTNQPTTVCASFNHAGPTTFNGYDYLTPDRRDGVTMYEMINSGKLHYPGFLTALKKGWRVAPMAGEDGHGTGRIKESYRTGVLATSLTREAIMRAMRQRRVYCTWDKNLHLSFSANDQIMGSVLRDPASLSIRVCASDPDTADPKDAITKIEIVSIKGHVVAERSFSAHEVEWTTAIEPKQKCYFVEIYTADKTDGPTAYSAPIWIERSAPSKIAE